MKINWFSPLPPERTDIAHYTCRLLHSLASHAKIRIWTDQEKWSPAITDSAPVHRYFHESIPWEMINTGDVSIFNIGNSATFHSRIWKISTYHPGIVILHDTRLQHLFAGIFHEQLKDRERYFSIMAHYYGKKGLEAASVFWKGGLTTEYMGEHFPLTDLALENATGVVVHTKQAFELIQEKNRWPVVLLPLPYPSVNHNNGPSVSQKSPPPYRLIAFGYIGPNRCLNSIFHALAYLPEKQLFELHIYGTIWDKYYIQKQISEFSLEDIVHLHGFVSENDLDNALAASHLAFNLRYPTMGEASGGQLRIWAHSLPSIVTRHGWYADLPSETVAFVKPHHEEEDIKKHLRQFLKNPEMFREIGRSGQKFLRDHHDPATYAAHLTRFSREATLSRLPALTHCFAKIITDETSIWLPQSHIDLLRPCAEEILKCRSARDNSHDTST